jgi:hypothetical protein
LESILDDFLSRKNKLPDNDKELYQVFGSVKNKELKKTKIKLKDFKEVSLNGQNFFPLLVNQNRNDGIICYKLRKVDFYQKFTFPYYL